MATTVEPKRVAVAGVRFSITPAGRAALAEPVTCPSDRDECRRADGADVCLQCAMPCGAVEGPAS